jgi:carboxypeptidase Q
VSKLAEPLSRIGANRIFNQGSAADVGALEPDGVPTMALADDESKYFWYHHTDADTVDKLDPRQLSLCVAAMAVMAYGVADAPSALPRVVKKPAAEK